MDTMGGPAAGEAARRRTFAVISHPDAGKSTLTEALALHAHAITEAGAVHGKSGRRGVASDWMEMEKARGISVTSAVLQFAHRGCVLNLLDTPGHADFSEDTYRVLAAVDCAVMLIDAAKGLEEQTRKLFDVCRHRGIPVITFVNKWDRPGREALELLDEIEREFRLRPTPLTWPVGASGYMHGLIDVREPGQMLRFTRTPGGSHEAVEEPVPAERAALEEGADWEQATEELQLLRADGAGFDRASFLAGTSTPVFFGAAISNIAYGCCWTPSSTSPRRRARACWRAAAAGRSTPRSPGSCSRCRRTWIPRTATGSPFCGCARASSSGARPSPAPPPANRSRPSTRTASSGRTAPWSTPPTPAMWSVW